MASHLLDTHVAVWLAAGSTELRSEALAAIARVQAGDGLAISAITAWEIALLQRWGKLQLSIDAHELFKAVTAELDAEPISIDSAIAAASVSLPGDLHADPADRILVATARIRRLTLVTRDRALLRYASEGHLEALRA